MQSPAPSQSPAVSPLVLDPVGTPIYTVCLLGFSHREHTLFGSVFSLSRSRPLRYLEFDPAAHPHADFYIVDADDAEAMRTFQQIDPQSFGGALFVGARAVASDVPLVPRPIRWAEVLMRLDELPRPAHSAQLAALVAAGLVELEQVPNDEVTPDDVIVADASHGSAQPTLTTPSLGAASLTAPTLTTPTLTTPSMPLDPPPGTATVIRTREENDLELSSIANWYDRDEVITFRTDPAVLVIDPDIAARRYMAAKFIDLKYRVDYAESGEQALEMINTHRYNAVFLETVLPGIDGYDVCKSVKSRSDRRRIAVIFVSSKNATFDRVKGAMAGCDAFLAKPIDQEKLVSTLDKFLPNWRLQLPIV